MEQRRFGDTDLVASAVGFGTWEMSTTMYGHIDVDEAARAVNMAIDRGITLFDTAEVYGPYHSEELLAKALGNRRNDIVLVTKVGFDYDDTPKVIGRNSKKSHIIQHTDDCLRRLNTDFVDLMLIHWPDHDTPIEETMEGLEELKQSGKIRHYGVSNFNIDMMEECEQYGHIAANQVGYNMYDRRMESRVLPWCQANGVGYMAYGSLGFGLADRRVHDRDTTFEEGDWRRSEHGLQPARSSSEEHFRRGSRGHQPPRRARRRLQQDRRPARPRLGPRPPRRLLCPRGHEKRARTRRERRRDRLETDRGNSQRNQSGLRRRRRADLPEHAADRA